MKCDDYKQARDQDSVKYNTTDVPERVGLSLGLILTLGVLLFAVLGKKIIVDAE